MYTCPKEIKCKYVTGAYYDHKIQGKHMFKRNIEELILKKQIKQ